MNNVLYEHFSFVWKLIITVYAGTHDRWWNKTL